jgi:uncharacterized Zn-finger protein
MSASKETDYEPVNGLIDFDENGNSIIIDKPSEISKPIISVAEILTSIDKNDKGPYECLICDKKFVKKDYWKRHVLSHENMFECEICNKKFTHHHHLNQHMTVHKETREHQCEICGFTVRFKFNLVKHKKTHIKFYDKKTQTFRYIK